MEKINFIDPADKTFWIYRIFDFNRAESTYYRTNFYCAIPANKMEPFGTKYYT